MPPLPPPITSRTNAKVKALRAAFSGKVSQRGELVGVEGIKSILQASEAGLRLDTVAILSGTDDAELDHLTRLQPRELLVLTPEVMASVADTVSPPTFAATVEIPGEEERQGEPSGLYLLLEEIQDPGNLGTLVRSAEAFGVERVFVSPGCANVWSPKVIRSSAGSVFRQPVSRQPVPDALAKLHAKGVRTFGAVAQQRGAHISHAADLTAPVALVIGNEGAGLSDNVLSRVDRVVYIPCLTESLNAAVAGSVLLYEALSQTVRLNAKEQKLAKNRTGSHEPV